MNPVPFPVRIRAELLDCLQANLAVLADRWHGAGRHLALGASLRFTPRPADDRLPTVEPSPDERFREAQRLAGLQIETRIRVCSGSEATALLRQHDDIYLVADAFDLPWLPYHRHEHMDHSFLVRGDGEDAVRVTDGYHNDTEWGRVRPGAWRLARREFEEMLTGGAQAVVLRAGAVAAKLPLPDVEMPPPEVVAGYLAAYRDHPDRTAALRRLTLETWLLARSRRLHVALREQVLGPQDEAIEWHLQQWGVLAEQTYLAYRRVRRGRPEPPGALDRLGTLLAADSALLSRPGLRERIAAEVAHVLGASPRDILAGKEFRAFPTFSSFRLIEIVERLEDRLAVNLAPDDLVPGNLRDIDTLCRVALQPVEAS